MCRLRKVPVGSRRHKQKACPSRAGSKGFLPLSPMCPLHVLVRVPLWGDECTGVL